MSLATSEQPPHLSLSLSDTLLTLFFIASFIPSDTDSTIPKRTCREGLVAFVGGNRKALQAPTTSRSMQKVENQGFIILSASKVEREGVFVKPRH